MVTGTQVLRAYTRAVKVLELDEAMTASEQSAGFILPPVQRRGCKKGYQVFVKVYRYSDELLARDELSGGLLACATKGGRKKQW